jgi:hypothetical protein
VDVSAERWVYDGVAGRTIHTPHYAIHTTITEDRVVGEMSQVMEGAFGEYQKMAPGVPVSDKPMECFVFATRPEWERFTRQHTGVFAETYLKINRGGYAVRDWYVAYYLGNQSTYSVSSHEGWHQFCGRNFKERLPPFLEEGIACLFEGVSLAGPHGLPQWNFSINLNRAVRLREVLQERRMIPLERLVTLHAGQVVASEGVDAFYAEDWAFARFMWEGAGGKYRPVLQKLIGDAAAGKMEGGEMGWRPEEGKVIIEHYFGMPLGEIEKEYMAFVSKVAFEQFSAQWQS